MAKHFNADAFTQCVFTWEGREYKFRPVSIRELINYYEGELFPRLQAAQKEKNAHEILKIQKEAIKRHLPELTDEVIDVMPQKVVQGLFLFIQHGDTPEEFEKN
jgi:hypothetical protein